MHLIEDNRKKGSDDDDDGEEKQGPPVHFPFDPVSEDVSLNDSEALKLRGKNSLAEEEGQEEDDNGSE
jgi:hypothetical protein